MQFLARKRRQPPAVIIVALIDVLIVLLIFLMVTTTFKQQPALKLALPESSHAQKAGASENAPAIVSIDEKGGLRFGQDARPVTMQDLKTALAAAASRNPDLALSINGDRGAPWGQIIRVLDTARDANIRTINTYVKEAPPDQR
jgi:biopolymer transport protein ExbD